MTHNILITGGSGYLGGTLLAHLVPNNPYSTFKLPPSCTIYVLVRTPSQASAIQHLGFRPLTLDTSSPAAISNAIVSAQISVIFFLIDALNYEVQVSMIKALGGVKRGTGKEVHFLHTSGAKVFSGHAGFGLEGEKEEQEEEEVLRDDRGEELYGLQMRVGDGDRVRFEGMRKAVTTNTTIIQTAKAHGVRSYIFIPCIVYGEGLGFGNTISIQTVAIVRAAKHLRRVYDVNERNPSWPVCHIHDTTTLYTHILSKILSGDDVLGYNENGYYLASSGAVPWSDIYAAMAKRFAARGIVDDDIVRPADDATLEEMGKALGVPKEMVVLQMGGRCALQAVHGEEIGWKAEYPPEHILETADAEVDLILRKI